MKEELNMSLDPRTADANAKADNASLLESKTKGVTVGGVRRLWTIGKIAILRS